MSPKEFAEKDSEKLFEDDEVLFIRTKGFPAIEYYGGDYLKTNYYPYRRNTIYLIIGKGGKKSYVIFVPEYGRPSVQDYDGKFLDFSAIIKTYPQMETEVLELTGGDTAYGLLKLIKSGKKVDKWQLKDVDECMVGITFNEKNPGKSMIQLLFDESEYFGFFEFSEGDWDKNILDSVFGSRYSSYNVIDSGYAYEEWKEGYLIGNLNNENYERLKDIIAFLSPEIAKMYKDGNEDSYRSSVSKFLDSNFEWFGEKLQEEYTDIRNEVAIERIKEEAIRDLADVFQLYGVIRNKGVFTYYVSVVNVLLSLYSLVQDKTISIGELFKEIGKEMNLSVGHYHEIGFENYDWDDKRFNETVSDALDQIMEEIENEPEKFERFKEYGVILSKLDKLGYEIGKQYKLPTNESNSFRIEEIQKDNGKIILIHWDGRRGEKRSYTFEEFVNYLNSPELFENLIRKLKKLL